jgi:aspartate/methionine/tyrosine aminotransferase
MKKWQTSSRMDAVMMPPIGRIMARVRELKSAGEKVFSMAQAVPWYGPPERALKALWRRMDDLGVHTYSPDPGLASARSALADDFCRRRGISLDPHSQLHLTCGASQAFLGALLAVADPGDRIVALEPWYFDHIFAIRFGSMELVSVPMIEDTGWRLPQDELEKTLDGARALVLVNPGNPTGSVLDREELEWLVKATDMAGCHLLIDETYERFNFTGSGWHPWEDGRPGHVITLGSFSKSLGMSGWRLGYLFGTSSVLEQALKVQDSVVICAPVPAQILMEEALEIDGWIEERASGVRMRLDRCREALAGATGLEWREAGGAFFTLAACPGRDSVEISEELLEGYRIATIPGSAFGPAGESHVRLSFGCIPDGDLDMVMETLASIRL